MRGAIAFIAPVVSALAIWWFARRYWLVKSEGDFLPFVGVVLGCLLLARDQASERKQAALRLVAGLCVFGGAAASGFHLVELIPVAWQKTSNADPGIIGVGHLDAFKKAYEATMIQYPMWSMPLGGSAVVLLLVGTLFSKLLVRKPIEILLGRNRDSDDGPWVGGWMSSPMIRQLKHNVRGIPLGLYRNALVRYLVDRDRGWVAGHHMVVAGTRAGKGTGCVLPALLDHEGPIAAVDIKGELFATCRRYRASLGRTQIVLNPFSLIEDAAHRFDPLTYIRPEHLERDIAVLVEGLIKPDANPQFSWISDNARTLCAATIELVMTEGLPEERSLIKMADLLLAPGREATFEAWRRAGRVCNGRLATAAENLLSMGDRQRGAILSAISENLEWLSRDVVHDMLSGSDFKLDDLLDDKLDLYLVVPIDMVEKMSNFFRLMMTLVIGTVTRQDGRRQAKRLIMPIFDEFTRMGRLEKVIEIATIGAGAKIEALFVVQDRGTLDATYGHDGANTVLGSCATTRIFGLGSTDEKTARWAESLLPYKTIIQESAASGIRQDRVNRSEVKERLMDAPSILQMPIDDMLCFVRSQKPIKLKQIVSHLHPAYRHKLDRNPLV